MANPIRRRGEWWQEQPDGGWLRWDEASGEWQPQRSPPPPPATEDESEGGGAGSGLHAGPAAVAPGDPPAPTAGYQYERATDGTWWARNERTGELHWHDPTTGRWRPYVAGGSPPGDPSGEAPASYAGFWQRFAALFIDGIVVVGVSFILGFFIGLILVTEQSTPQQVEDVNAIASVAGFVLQWIYFAVMESSSKQATLGKLALDLRVTDEQGNRIGFGRATGRYFAKILSTLILLIGYLMVAWTKKKQGLHDRMAGTLVLEGRVR